MKVILLQTDICWADPAANVAYMDKLISAHAQDTDLFVLPEMFSTGFCTSPEGIAESSDSATLRWMKQKAAERNCAIAGSVSVEENGKFYNRFYFVHPDGNVQWYNKKHLFTYGGEDKHYTAGQERVVVNCRGVRFLLEVCYDLRFPQLFRRQTGVDCFLLPAAFTTNTGKAHWEVLLRARAIENLSYVVAAAQAGRSSCGRAFWGHSCAVDPWGTVVGSLNGHETGVCFTDVDPAFLRQVRALLPALNNRVKYE